MILAAIAHSPQGLDCTSARPSLWILFASLMFATMSALVKVAAARRVAPGDRVLSNVAGRDRPLRRWHAFASRASPPLNWKLLALRCCISIGGVFVSFYAVSNLPLATATTLEYTTPIFMLAYIVVIARSGVTPPMAFAMIGGFVGVVVLLRPTVQAGQTLAFAAGLCSGILAGLAYTLIRKLGEANEPTSRIILLVLDLGECRRGGTDPVQPAVPL